MKVNWLRNGLGAWTIMAGVLLVAGCGDSAQTSADNDAAAPAALPEGLILTSAPGEAQPIKSLKASAKQGDEVVVRGVVGGRIEPIVEGRASAAIVDAGLENPCMGEDDHCATPWDYCCSLPEDITANLATLQVVDSDGRVIAVDLSKQMKPGTTVVVRGIVGPRPDAKVLTINATGIYIEPAGS